MNHTRLVRQMPERARPRDRELSLRHHSQTKCRTTKDCFAGTPKPARETRGLPRTSLRVYFFGVGAGFAGAGAGAPAAAASTPNVQCASTFLPSDFALTITVHELSRNFCVT